MGLSQVEQTLYLFQGSICSTLKKKQMLRQFFEQKIGEK